MDSTYNTHTFENGLQVAWKKTPTNTIFANLRINHGALHEQPGEEGTAHFLEHMFIEGGTRTYTPQEQAALREGFGYSNAFTSRDRTMIPSGMNPEQLPQFLELAAEMAFHPRLDEEVLANQKEIVKREIARKRGSPSFNDYHSFYYPELFRTKEHTYFVLGDEGVIDALTPEKLEVFRARGYNPNTMVLMLAGDLPDDIIPRVEAIFGSYPQGAGEKIEYPTVSPLEQKAILYSPAPELQNKQNPANSNSSIQLGFIVPDEKHADSAAMQLLARIVGGSKTEGLYKRIRSDEGLAYQIGAWYATGKNAGSIDVGGKIKQGSEDRVLDIVFEEFARAQDEPFSQDLFDRTKQRLQYVASSSVPGVFSNLVRVDPINVATIGKMDNAYSDKFSAEERIEMLEKVSLADVQRVAQQYLPRSRDEGAYVLLVRDPMRTEALRA